MSEKLITLVISSSLATIIGKALDVETVYFLGIVFLLVGIVFATLTYVTIRKPTDEIDYIEYEVLIDDSVSFTEFNDKYDIINQKGKIYVVREKEND